MDVCVYLCAGAVGCACLPACLPACLATYREAGHLLSARWHVARSSSRQAGRQAGSTCCPVTLPQRHRSGRLPAQGPRCCLAAAAGGRAAD